MGAEKLLLNLKKSTPEYKAPRVGAGKPVNVPVPTSSASDPTASSTSASAFDSLKLEEYDIVIIGGGTAGCILAGRYALPSSLLRCDDSPELTMGG